MRLFVVLCLALVACGGSEPASSTDAPGTSATSGAEPASNEPTAELPAELPSDVPVEPSTTAPPEALPLPDERLAFVTAAAASDEAFLASVDPARGLLVIHYEESGPGASRSRGTRSNRHLCGAALRRGAADARAILASAQEQADEEEWTCTDEECVAPGMEWSPAIHVRLGRTAEGARTITGLHVVSEAALGEEWIEAARVYVERAQTSAARGCPAARAR